MSTLDRKKDLLLKFVQTAFASLSSNPTLVWGVIVFVIALAAVYQLVVMPWLIRRAVAQAEVERLELIRVAESKRDSAARKAILEKKERDLAETAAIAKVQQQERDLARRLRKLALKPGDITAGHKLGHATAEEETKKSN